MFDDGKGIEYIVQILSDRMFPRARGLNHSVRNFFSAPRHSFPERLSLSPNDIAASLGGRIHFTHPTVVVITIVIIGIGGGGGGGGGDDDDDDIHGNSGGGVTPLIK